MLLTIWTHIFWLVKAPEHLLIVFFCSISTLNCRRSFWNEGPSFRRVGKNHQSLFNLRKYPWKPKKKKWSYMSADLFKREVVHFPYHYPQGYSNAVGALLYMWAGIWVGEQIAQLIGWIDQRECRKTRNLLAFQLITLFQKAKSAATGCRRTLQHPWRGGLLVAPPLVHGADAVVLSSWAIAILILRAVY